MLVERLVLVALVACSAACPAASPVARAQALPGDRQQSAAVGAQASAQPVASVQTDGVTLHGALSVANGRAVVANNGDITAGEKTAQVALERGGTLLVCASTTVHIAKDATAHTGTANDAGLMFSMDRGAFEAHYTPGTYSDVVMTPDLRMLISPPGHAELKLNVNAEGDTCVDNAGAGAPYVTVSSLAEGGVYRVRPGQRVLFVKGSLQEVVDNEREPCGCPSVAAPVANVADGKSPGGPSSKPSDTAFPLAVSEGLQPQPAPATTPVVPAGQVHAQVAATLSSNTPPVAPSGMTPIDPAAAAATAPAAKAEVKPAPPRGFFHAVGHFFAKVFGAQS